LVIACPFCGAVTGLPHESQGACIAALQEEIARTREMVERVKATAARVSGNDQNPSDETKPDK
jgi:hypothetical protein